MNIKLNVKQRLSGRLFPEKGKNYMFNSDLMEEWFMHEECLVYVLFSYFSVHRSLNMEGEALSNPS